MTYAYDDINIDLREIACKGVDFIHLVLDMDCWQALANMVINVWVQTWDIS
jgi:hypothetical protein